MAGSEVALTLDIRLRQEALASHRGVVAATSEHGSSGLRVARGAAGTGTQTSG